MKSLRIFLNGISAFWRCDINRPLLLQALKDSGNLTCFEVFQLLKHNDHIGRALITSQQLSWLIDLFEGFVNTPYKVAAADQPRSRPTITRVLYYQPPHILLMERQKILEQVRAAFQVFNLSPDGTKEVMEDFANWKLKDSELEQEGFLTAAQRSQLSACYTSIRLLLGQ